MPQQLQYPERCCIMDIVMENLHELISCHAPTGLLRLSPLALLAVIAAPHFLYAFVWMRPTAWMQAFPKNPVEAFSNAALIGKGA